MAAKRAREDEVQSGGATADGEQSKKKPRHGFKVGPDNLPDGTWRRKVIKIKENLIVQAKVKKQYAKVKASLEKQQQEQQEQAKASETAPPPPPPTTNDASTAAETAPHPESAPQIHPARQAMLDDPNAPTQQLPPPRAARIVGPPAASANATTPLSNQGNPNATTPLAPTQEDEYRNAMDLKRSKTVRNREKAQRRPGYFDKQLAEAEAKKAELDARLAEVARREAEKTKRIADREKYRKAMAKARLPGRDGKRKVGREGNLLLDKVKRIVGA
ncbi:hypothetical protein B0T19DRAFT_476609 [Cercophora scortea]|uniref:rRNA-processing protein FYV7 n=1 Tax=Cercophora scortea TaxID=314031 RepID=A0AAE0M9J3_9PEZI|nr:hypothetical protein B0T19DRAFT_476609 [Cercophora scortea]